jgi:hypothetical protein
MVPIVVTLCSNNNAYFLLPKTLHIRLLFVGLSRKEMGIQLRVEPALHNGPRICAAPPVLTASLIHLGGGRRHRPAVSDQSKHRYVENRQTRTNLRSTQS